MPITFNSNRAGKGISAAFAPGCVVGQLASEDVSLACKQRFQLAPLILFGLATVLR